MMKGQFSQYQININTISFKHNTNYLSYNRIWKIYIYNKNKIIATQNLPLVAITNNL